MSTVFFLALFDVLAAHPEAQLGSALPSDGFTAHVRHRLEEEPLSCNDEGPPEETKLMREARAKGAKFYEEEELAFLPPPEDISNEALLGIVKQELPDAQVNELVWKYLGYKRNADGSWDNSAVFPKWRERFPLPPDFIGHDDQASYAAEDGSIKIAVQGLQQSVPKEHKQRLKPVLTPHGWSGFVMQGLTPNMTRRAQCANWLLYYRTSLHGVPLEELVHRKEKRQKWEAEMEEINQNLSPASGTSQQSVFRRLAAARRLAPATGASELFFGEAQFYMKEYTPEGDAGDAWQAAWRRRVACWWLALPLPTQQQVGACMGAFSLHLGSRLEASWRAAQSRLGRTAPPSQMSAQSAKPGCEWLRTDVQLELPSVPELPSDFDFILPPIPQLLPTWQQLQSLNRQHPHLAAALLSPARSQQGSSIINAGIGLGFVAGVLLVVGVASLRRRVLTSNRVQLCRRSIQSQKRAAVGMTASDVDNTPAVVIMSK